MAFSTIHRTTRNWAALLLAVVVGQPAFAEKSLGDLTGPWQLFTDDYLIATKENVARTYHAFKKHAANPIVKPDQPWEFQVVTLGSVLPGEKGDGFRMWYDCWTHKDDPDGGHEMLATSRDGIHWEKPVIGLKTWKVNGSKTNNFVDASGSVMHTPNDPDPSRRYKCVPGPYYFNASPDGIRWTRLSKGEAFKAGDTGHVMWDPFQSKFRCYAKVNAMVTGQRRRAVGYSEGTGYDDWPALRMVLAPDDFDDRWVKPGSVQRTHFYNCPVVAYQTMYLGFISIYRAEDDEGYFHGPIYTELVTSRDGFHWLREEGQRPPILECGPERSWDHGMILIGSACLLPVGDELRLYYTGYDGLHDYLPFHAGIGVATLRKDGFASIDGGDNPGNFTTKRLQGLKGKLHLNCEAGGGLLQVEVLDAGGRVIPGYGKGDCNEPRGDGVDQIVTWREHAELPTDKGPLRLRFVLKNVSLYSFMAGDVVEVLEETARPRLAALFTFENNAEPLAASKLPGSGQHELRFRGTSRVDHEAGKAAFGKRSVTVHSPWRPNNTLQITGTKNLGTQFTLAAMAKSENGKLARLFSAYSGNKPTGTSELIFDCDPGGNAHAGLRLYLRGMPVTSKPVTFADGKYHHLAVTWDDGHVQFYLDGSQVGDDWLPGGAPIRLARDLLVGEDAELGSDEQFVGNLDDILVLGRALGPEEMKQLATQGAETFFKKHQ